MFKCVRPLSVCVFHSFLQELDHLVKGYARLGRMEEAERHYKHYLDKKVFPSNATLGAMIDSASRFRCCCCEFIALLCV